MDVSIIIIVLTIHFIADFIFQDESWAKGKSNSFKMLLRHVAMYFVITFGLIYGISHDFMDSWNYAFIVSSLHLITDYFTSVIVANKFAKGEYGSPIPNFGAFTIIGFDQLLHYIQLFITYKMLFL